MGSCTLGASHLHNCGLTGTLTLSQATTYTLQTCHSEIAGSGSPTIDFGAAVGNMSLNMRRYSGGVEVQNMGVTGTDTMSLEGHGALTINANCTGGTIVLRGLFTVTDNSGGAVTVTYDDGVQTVLSILEDTNELQADWTNGGRLDLILDAILAMLDDPRAEPGQGAPAVNADAMTKLDYLYKAWRNRTEQTATTLSIYNDAGTVVDQKATVSDDGTTATRTEIATGP
jgi:hypothetical protein